MAYYVTAPCVLAKDQAGRIHYHYESINPVIPWLSDEQAEHFLAQGLVEPVADDPAVDGGGKPSKRASKETWEAYVIALTADTEAPVTEDEAKAASKSDLISLYGGDE
jgi:hypothetical protein